MEEARKTKIKIRFSVKNFFGTIRKKIYKHDDTYASILF